MSSEVEIQPWSATEYSNLALVQEIKKHPCLYNNTLPEYSRKDITGKIWQDIADKFGCTVPFVKKKWMKLRSTYSKELLKRKKGKTTIHPIVPHINFIHPFCVKYQQSNIHKGLQNNPSDILHKKINNAFPVKNNDFDEDLDYNDIEITEVIIVEDDDKLTVTNSADVELITTVDDEVRAMNNNAVDNEGDEVYTTDCVENNNLESLNSKSDHPVTFELNNNETEIYSSPQRHESNTEVDINNLCSSFNQGNPRLHYVLSLLPEVDEMTEKQFRFFKRKMLALIDEINDSFI